MAANNDSFGIFIFDCKKDNIYKYLTHICHRKIKMSLLLITRPCGSQLIYEIKSHLSEMREATYFYVAMVNNNGTITWKRIISLKSGNILDALIFANDSLRIIETFDMQGLEIRSTSLTWAPYLTLEDCDNDGLNCKKNYGYLHDYMEKLADMFNFTFSSQQNVDNHWGISSDSYRLSDDGRGVLNAIANKEYDMCLSVWLWKNERAGYAQFVPVAKFTHALAMKLDKPGTDFGLFLRAFSINSWICILLIAGAAVACILLVDLLNLEEDTNVPNIVTFTFHIFFVLVYSYYCGVLITFFATTDRLPFETEKEVLQAYPNWRLKFEPYLVGEINHKASQGDPVYVLAMKKYEENPSEWTYDSLAEGLEFVMSGQHVIKSGEGKLLNYIKSNGMHRKIYVFGQTRSEPECLIFHLNSPLVPMFRQGASFFKENGIENDLYNKWFGLSSPVSASNPEQGTAFDLGQMVWLLVSISALYVLTLIVLCGELLFQRLKHIQQHGESKYKSTQRDLSGVQYRRRNSI